MSKPPCVCDRDALAAEALPLVRWQARRFRSLPRGMDVEDLESAGHEAILEALLDYDPASAISFSTHAKQVIRSRMQDAIRAARSRSKGRVALQIENDDGTATPLPADPRASDPGEVAIAREALTAPRRMTIETLQESLPSPTEVAAKVVKLRAAMFEGIDPDGIRQVMGNVMAQAKAGDLKAVRLLVDLLAPRGSGVTVNQMMVTPSEVT